MDHPEEVNHSWNRTIPDHPHGPDPITNQTENRHETGDGQDISGETGGVHCSYYSETYYHFLLSFPVSTQNSVPKAQTELIPISTLFPVPHYDS
jgi:hypothetical protein